MIYTMAAVVLATVSVQETDTTFTVSPDARLDVSNYAGEIIVQTWDRNAVRIRADHSSRDEIVVEMTSSEVTIRAASWQRWADAFDIHIDNRERVRVRVREPRLPRLVTYELTVPAAMALQLGGPYTHVSIEGTEGEVSVRVNEGDITVNGGSGQVSIRSIEGNVELEATEGRIDVFAMDGDVWIRNASGSIEAETTDGEITMENIRALGVRAASVDGDIIYSGTIEGDGLYSFVTHDGDVTATIPAGTSARVTVATFDGELKSEFPVTLPERYRGRRLRFTLGSGDAQIEIEAFDGDIELLRSEGQ